MVAVQHTESRKAIFGVGEFMLMPEFSSYYIEHSQWNSMSVQQQDKYIRKMIEAIPNYTVVATDHESTSG